MSYLRFVLTGCIGILLATTVLGQSQHQLGPDTSDHRMHIWKTGGGSYYSSGLAAINTQLVVGKVSGTLRYRAFYQWDLPNSVIPESSSIDQARIEFTVYPQGGAPQLNFYLSKINYDISTSTDWGPIFDDATVSGNVLATGRQAENNTYAETFSGGSAFCNGIASQLPNDRFTLAVCATGEDQYDRYYSLPSYLVKLTIWYTPPVQSVAIDQKLENNQSYGEVGLWNGTSFADSTVPYTLTFEINTVHTLLADTNFATGTTQRHNNWNNQSYIQNHGDFSIQPGLTAITSRFKTAHNATLQAQLIDGGSPGGSTNFKDPWLRDSVDSKGTLNRGLNAISHGVSYSSNNVGVTSVHLGVYFDEGGSINNWTPPYYSLGTPLTQTINGVDSYFMGWSAHPDSAELRSPDKDTSAVVFKAADAKVKALYKGYRHSSLSTATGFSGQRKLIWMDNYHTVYESAGDVWYTKSADGSTWTKDTMLSRGAGKARNPSLAEMGWSNVLYATWVDTTVRTGASGYDVYVKKLNLTTSQWSSTEAIVHPDYPSGAGYARADARPVAVAYSESDVYPHVVVAYEGAGTGIRYSLKSYNNYYGTSVWKTEIVPTTGTNSGRPSMTLGHDAGWNNMYLVLTYDSTYAIRIATSTNFVQNPICSYVLFNTPTTIPGSIAFFMHANSSVDIDQTGRQHVTWRALDEELGGSDVALHRSRDLSGNWSALNEFVSELVDGPNVTTTVSANVEGSGGTVLFSDRSNLLNYASSDAVNWEFLGYTHYASGVKYPSLVPKFWLSEEASVVTKNSSSPYEVAFEIRDNSEVLQKRLALQNIAAEPGLVTRYQRIDISDTTTNSWLSLALGNSSLVDQSGAEIRKIGLTFTPGGSSDGPGLRSVPFTLSPGASYKAIMRANGKAPRTGAVISLDLVDYKTGATIATLFQEGAASGAPIQRVNTVMSATAGIDQTRILAVVLNLGGMDAARFVADSVEMAVVKAPPSGLQKQHKAGGTESLPTVYALHPNYPNPFNPTTTFRYDLPSPGNTSLIVYNTLGQIVAELVRGFTAAGSHSITWSASSIASGVYFARFTVVDDLGRSQANQVIKVILMK